MQRATIGRIALAVVVLATAVLLLRRGGDERQIRRAIADIQRLVARTPAESELAGLASARRIAAYFTDPFSVTAEPAGLATRDRRQLVGAIHRYRSRSPTLFMRVYDEAIELDETRARMTLIAEFVSDLRDLAGAERYPMVIHWRRVDGEWRIESVEVLTG